MRKPCTGANLADLEKRIQQLEDVEAIRNLIASYGPAADRGDADAVSDIWWEDGEYDVGGFGVSKGREAIAGLITGEFHQQLMIEGCAHVLSPHEISIVGNHADAVGYSTVFRKVDGVFEAWRVSFNQWTFEKRGKEWRTILRVNRPVEGLTNDS